MKLNLKTKYNAAAYTGATAELELGQLLAFTGKTLLFFYPADNTSGCTVENKDFTSLVSEFHNLGIMLLGVSKDSIESHIEFMKKQELKVDLVSDPELTLHKELGAYGEKNNYGKKVKGVIRSTFLLDEKGKILKEWKNVRAKGHAERVLKEIKEMEETPKK